MQRDDLLDCNYDDLSNEERVEALRQSRQAACDHADDEDAAGWAPGDKDDPRHAAYMSELGKIAEGSDSERLLPPIFPDVQ